MVSSFQMFRNPFLINPKLSYINRSIKRVLNYK
jgi:hypothetical protein